MNAKLVLNFSMNIPKKKLRSNLQKSILAFYRESLKFCYSKPEVQIFFYKFHYIHSQQKLIYCHMFVMSSKKTLIFRKINSIEFYFFVFIYSYSNLFCKIEYLLRTGKNQLSSFKEANIENIDKIKINNNS